MDFFSNWFSFSYSLNFINLKCIEDRTNECFPDRNYQPKKVSRTAPRKILTLSPSTSKHFKTNFSMWFFRSSQTFFIHRCLAVCCYREQKSLRRFSWPASPFRVDQKPAELSKKLSIILNVINSLSHKCKVTNILTVHQARRELKF